MKSTAAFNLSRVPLTPNAKKDPQSYTTPWPVENRKPNPITADKNRNLGSRLFRRYHNGRLDVRWAKGIVREALYKSNCGIPLTEHEAVAVSVIYPEVRFDGLPKKVVDLKAKLSDSEICIIRCALDKEVAARQQSWNSGHDF